MNKTKDDEDLFPAEQKILFILSVILRFNSPETTLVVPLLEIPENSGSENSKYSVKLRTKCSPFNSLETIKTNRRGDVLTYESRAFLSRGTTKVVSIFTF